MQSIDEYFMWRADECGALSTCPRAERLGCVIVATTGSILGTGWAAAFQLTTQCDHIGCDIDNGGCVRTIHAEQRALLTALEECAPLVRGATAYVSKSPCWTCMKLLVFAGVTRIVYRKEYRTGIARQIKLAAEYRISFEQLKE